MSECPYPAEIYDFLERVLDGCRNVDWNDPETERLIRMCREERLAEWESSEEQTSAESGDGRLYEITIPHPDSYCVTGKGDLALRRYKNERTQSGVDDSDWLKRKDVAKQLRVSSTEVGRMIK